MQFTGYTVSCLYLIAEGQTLPNDSYEAFIIEVHIGNCCKQSLCDKMADVFVVPAGFVCNDGDSLCRVDKKILQNCSISLFSADTVNCASLVPKCFLALIAEHTHCLPRFFRSLFGILSVIQVTYSTF